MKKYALPIICVWILLILAGSAGAQTTTLTSTFTYQGHLTGVNGAVSAVCDFQFSLYNALAGGTQVGSTQTKTNVLVTNGSFTVQLGFSATAFDGTDRYLQIAVRCPAGSGSYTTLSPRQTITAAPYALGLYGLEVQYNPTSPNLIGGYSGNNMSVGIVGATISGGGEPGAVNQVTGHGGTVGGGMNNVAGTVATIGGGAVNIASGHSATVAGGFQNTASGDQATVAGGTNNRAAGNFSFAAGRDARADHAGAFVWADSIGLPFGFFSTASNQFSVHAAGGVRFVTGSDGQGNDQVYCYMYPGIGSWSCSSDRNSKESFEAIDSQAVLSSVVNLPITSWIYKGTTTRHIGPMAQDFYAAFGIGEDDRTITGVDADGVALAAIQGLNHIVEEQHEQIAALKAENSELKIRLDDIESRLSVVESAAIPMSESSLVIPALVLGMLAFVWRRKG